MKKILIVLIIIITIIILLNADELLSRSKNPTNLSAKEFSDMIEHYRHNKIEFRLLDIRTKPEFDQGHIAGAEMLDFYAPDFVEKLKQLDREQTYLIYCRSGNRTGQTIKLMAQLGFQNVSHLKNGIISWVRSGYILD